MVCLRVFYSSSCCEFSDQLPPLFLGPKILISPAQIQRELQLRIEAQGQSLQKMFEAQAKAGGMVVNSEGPAKEQITTSSKPLESPVLPLKPSQGAPAGPESLQLDVVNGEDPSSEEPSTKKPRVVMQPLVIVPDPSYLQEVSEYGPLGKPVQTPACTAVPQAPTISPPVGGLMST